MYSSSHEQQQFAETVQQRQQADEQALSNDANVMAAHRAVEKAHADLDNLQSYISSLPSRDRATYLSSLDTYLLAVSDAEQALVRAQNDFWKNRRLTHSAEQKAERERLAEEQQRLYAQQQEAQFKEAKRTAYLAAGATEAQFNAAYPDLWQRELERRAAEQEKGLQQRMHREIGYVKF